MHTPKNVYAHAFLTHCNPFPSSLLTLIIYKVHARVREETPFAHFHRQHLPTIVSLLTSNYLIFAIFHR